MKNETFFYNGWRKYLSPNFMGKLKITIHEAPILLLYKNIEIGANFTLFNETATVKLGAFDR
jgi:hypothetical protein